MRELTQPVKEGVDEYDPTLTTRSVIASRNEATSHEEPKISMNAVERLKKMKGSEKSKAHLGYEADVFGEADKAEEDAATARRLQEEAAAADAKRKEEDDQHDKAQYYGQSKMYL